MIYPPTGPSPTRAGRQGDRGNADSQYIKNLDIGCVLDPQPPMRAMKRSAATSQGRISAGSVAREADVRIHHDGGAVARVDVVIERLRIISGLPPRGEVDDAASSLGLVVCVPFIINIPKVCVITGRRLVGIAWLAERHGGIPVAECPITIGIKSDHDISIPTQLYI